MALNRDPLADPEPLIRRVYSYIAYRLGDGPDAEDVTSTVFERALRYRSSFQAGKGEPIAWLLGIARRCVDEAFVARRSDPLPLHEQAAPGDLEAETLIRVRLASALAGLEERDRELVALRYGADLSTRAIGELLGMERSAVDVALHRARTRLRQALEADDAESRDEAGGRRAVGSS
jgi:RNA polymerase sigma factor (sigma-70 family)